MRQIDSYFYDSPDEPLFHYTGMPSLDGIAKSREVWASHIYYLNDSKELLYACEVLGDALLEPSLVFGQEDTPRNRFLRDLKAWSEQMASHPSNLFVFSLSTQRSQLSQWRSYTPHGKGVSIAFSSGLVREVALSNEMRLGKCLYDYPSQLMLIEGLVGLLWESACQRPVPGPLKFAYYPLFEEFRTQIHQVLALIKHEAFSEEQEWRMISRVLPTSSPLIHYRPGEGASLLVPYIKLAIGKHDYPFDLIILGPTPHEMLAEHALGGFLRSSKISANLETSRIPFRKW